MCSPETSVDFLFNIFIFISFFLIEFILIILVLLINLKLTIQTNALHVFSGDICGFFSFYNMSYIDSFQLNILQISYQYSDLGIKCVILQIFHRLLPALPSYNSLVKIWKLLSKLERERRKRCLNIFDKTITFFNFAAFLFVSSGFIVTK